MTSMLINIPIVFYSSVSLLFFMILLIIINDIEETMMITTTTTTTQSQPSSILRVLLWVSQSRSTHPITIKLITSSIFVLLILPIGTSIVAWITDLPRRRRFRRRQHQYQHQLSLLPFLPDSEHASSKEEYDSVYNYLTTTRKDMNNNNQQQQQCWALITGASQGIGRALSISFARRNINVVLVARNIDKLNLLSQEITNCYPGVNTEVIQCDISKEDDIHSMMKTIERKQLDIHILVANAGIGDRNNFSSQTKTKIDTIVNLNIIGTTKIIQKIVIQMKKKKYQQQQQQQQPFDGGGGKIIVISSIAGSVPGVPTSAVYAASKAYQFSLCASIGRELEKDEETDDENEGNNGTPPPPPISVQCVMPGAVRDTNFSEQAGMNNTLFFQKKHDASSSLLSLISLSQLSSWIGLTVTPEYVAETTVKEILSMNNKKEIYIGWINIILCRIMCYLLPRRLLLLICEFTFSDISLQGLVPQFVQSIISYFFTTATAATATATTATAT
eukprot:CAMPEP_0170861686 /NCGR_PEP_ID=MMETSP0734-20130129/18426_1 /TAXON_ID=186038 /ORGANISM="Fragilariopsis kerguelensis, Strain L26-C5" /LENGTH=502 /DNA_ID=CAMNT_0011235943 /DNA_START=183 /DNA_END=1688 /DNA_ORIENTATION=-